jgi:hypothetical protein
MEFQKVYRNTIDIEVLKLLKELVRRNLGDI